MDFKNVLKNRNFLLAIFAAFVCFVNIVLVFSTSAYLQNTGAAGVLVIFKNISSLNFNSGTTFMTDLILKIPFYIAQVFVSNKMTMVNIFGACYILYPLLMLFASYKLAKKTQKNTFFYYQLFVFAFAIVPSFSFVFMQNLMTQVVGIQLFLLLVQYLNSETEYTTKDYVFIAVLLSLQFANSQANMLLGIVYFVAVLIYLAIYPKDTNKNLKIFTASVIFIAALYSICVQYCTNIFAFDNFYTSLSNNLRDMKFYTNPIYIVSALAFCLIFINQTFNKKTIAVILILYLIGLFNVFKNPGIYVFSLASSDLEFLFNIAVPILTSAFMIVVAINDAYNKLPQEENKLLSLSSGFKNLFFNNRKTPIFFLAISAVLYLVAGVGIFIFDKTAFEFILPFAILFFLSCYMLYDYIQVEKLNDNKEKIDYCNGTIKTLFIFLIYFIYSLCTSPISKYVLVHVFCLILLSVTISYFSIIRKTVEKSESTSQNENVCEGSKGVLAKNLLTVVLLHVIFISVFSSYFTILWKKNYDFIKSALDSYQGRIYVEQENQVFQNWEGGLFYGSNYLTIPLSILLSKNHSVDKMILSFDKEDLSNNFLSDIYSISDKEVFVPWTVISKQNKYYDITEILQDIDNFKQEHGL